MVIVSALFRLGEDYGRFFSFAVAIFGDRLFT
jgi:hypothetical protein